jgi:hypothetical protein
VFETRGDPLPFEQVERYKARLKKDRFTFDMLQDYSKALGLRPFDEDFYMPAGTQAILVERTGLTNVETITLSEAQKRL